VDTFVVFVESLGKRKGRLPRLIDFDSRAHLLEALHVLLVGEDLGKGEGYFHLLGDYFVWL
jgi:hypothetical protein